MTLLHLHTPLPDAAGATPPAWLHLLPAGEFRGADGRGPYRAGDAAAVIRASMAGGKLVLDENHATDHALQSGGSAPAIGWIVELQSRDDGIWGRVDWNRRGTSLMADRAYRGLSPAFSAPGGTVDRIHRASLTNAPNLSLTHLHSQEPRMDLADVRRRLGLPETAAQADVERALDTARGAISLHSQIAGAAGLAATVTGQELVTGITAKLAGAGQQSQQVVELQSQVAALQKEIRVKAATDLVDGAARDGRVIPETLRPQLIELHQTNPAMAEALIQGLPSVTAGGLRLHNKQPGNPTADAVNAQVAGLLGVSVDDMRKQQGSAA